MKKHWLLLVILLLSPVSIAKEIELSGLVLDRTLTRFGKDFVFYFSSYWRDLPQTDGISVVVYERVYPQAGTYLWVEMNQTRIYATYFGRRYNNIKEKAEQATLVAVNELAQIRARVITGEGLEQGL
ncbi:MAG: curli production assembly/transport protein CsgE [Pseudomonadota bacterium]|uniref:Curli production assembly/transport component CsgE n=1 Tax=Gallaecimonas pentaromativorans TaxID=584787 RepID=A0A3N1PHW5_9GAMM|nr:curli production assembly/transport protein CsgE [Gallaecimonas pentaromativorans]MED5524897.1 curli production assembly/transport protein CsgE [Pseudomonadota bacterium]ROQ24156.1 curli production assembly/transport component CsgE [Gallaecimonas pentaromativorans]